MLSLSLEARHLKSQPWERLLPPLLVPGAVEVLAPLGWQACCTVSASVITGPYLCAGISVPKLTFLQDTLHWIRARGTLS